MKKKSKNQRISHASLKKSGGRGQQEGRRLDLRDPIGCFKKRLEAPEHCLGQYPHMGHTQTHK